MTTLPSMGLILPTRGSAGAGTWDDTLDADLTKLDGHDHTEGNGASIRTNSINIDDDLSFHSLWAAVALNRISFASVATPTMSKSLFVSSGAGGLSANELYFRNNVGTNIKVTSGNSLNVAGFAGGIGGDYTAVGASVSFDDVNKRYTFKDGSTNWARIQAGGVRISELGTTAATFVQVLSPAALAVSYSLTFPGALPGSKLIAQVDATGAITFSNTIPAATIFSSTATFAGLITASSGLTAGVDQHVTVSGIGTFKHGTRTLQIPLQGPTIAGGSDQLAFTSGTVTAPIPLHLGARILLVRAVAVDSVTGPTKVVVGLRVINSGGSTLTGTGTQSAGSGAVQTLTSTALTTVVVSGTRYRAECQIQTGSASCTVSWFEVDYDQP